MQAQQQRNSSQNIPPFNQTINLKLIYNYYYSLKQGQILPLKANFHKKLQLIFQQTQQQTHKSTQQKKNIILLQIYCRWFITLFTWQRQTKIKYIRRSQSNCHQNYEKKLCAV
ncbi:hypothetical protein PPERSA_11577 [Pseudocohnilembus persalinus]|uniref:Uncharacterized protein n=1 Tax=Pseudocohnilembus persalinus TaxID=266149 RepID=A0A0V0Q9W8_PSEPJ|nr:hypothetical protein PPERSA_11577 [Pseudocohnilembus persalinus]|eukprot:KRW98976.1 hypothetical protein PPERSA_11577 [Pseudocohnilembus persalinus]